MVAASISTSLVGITSGNEGSGFRFKLSLLALPKNSAMSFFSSLFTKIPLSDGALSFLLSQNLYSLVSLIDILILPSLANVLPELSKTKDTLH